ncbi:MAG: hypothetical protein C0606_13800 [Hyphomicrobiales bacterium]|nr:MAG: hypothetical protein C0606_13800 [Hyphomicrobiales bacterium]
MRRSEIEEIVMPKTSRPSICFITNELYPAAPGGIGRMLYNFAKQNEALGFPAEINFLIPTDFANKPGAMDALDDAFEGIAEIHVFPKLQDLPDAFAHALFKHRPWTLELHISTSYRYYLGLRELERKRKKKFDFIEFPDFGGWGTVSIEAKRAGIAFQDTIIGVRIHSTLGLISSYERYSRDPGPWDGVVLDSERHQLTYADLIVGHDPLILETNTRFYDLDERWRDRVVCEFPPIMLDLDSDQTGSNTRSGETEEHTDVSPANRDFIFSSRLQPFKRPDLFVYAAVAFLERNPDYQGVCRVVSYGWDDEYIAGLQDIVPPHLADRIPFIFDATPAERDDYLQNSVVVIPSEYESLCLFAYESSQMGCQVILNRDCVVFGQNARWKDGDNCVMFDGTVDDLVLAMERVRDWTPRSQVDFAADTPYWLLDKLPSQVSIRDEEPGPRANVSVVCFGFQEVREFQKLFSSLVHIERELQLADGSDEIVFLLPRALFSPGGNEQRLIEERGWKAEFIHGFRESAETFSRRLRQRDSECILLVEVGFELYPGFVPAAKKAMERDGSLQIVGGHVEILDSDTGHSDYLKAYGGEMPSLALVSSQIAPPTSMFRRSLLERIGFDPHAAALWFEVFVRKCVLAGEKIVVAPLFCASLDPVFAEKPDTTVRINGGITDAVGRELGFRGRLLAFGPLKQPDKTGQLSVVLGPDKLKQAIRINPVGRVRNWEPVFYRNDLKGLQVHPLNGDVTIAEVIGPSRKMRRIQAVIHNGHAENTGIEAAIAIVPKSAETPEIVQFLTSESKKPGFAMSSWVEVPPKETLEIDLATLRASNGRDRILMVSRLPLYSNEDFGHLVFRKIEIWLNTNLR